jgi:hypothetical protein
VRWPRRPEPEPALEREDVLAIFDALIDIRKWTYDVWTVIVGEDEDDEDEP